MARIDDGLVTYIDTSDHLISADVELLPARSLRDATIRNCPMASTAPAGGAVVPIRPATAKYDLGHDPVVADSTGLVVEQVRLVVGGHRRLDDVTFTARPGTLTTNIGPSGTGKSTLIKVLAGATAPSAGRVRFDGQHVHAENACLRRRIDVVPQDDAVHPQLTVEQALRFAVELRLPGASAVVRESPVIRVLGELKLLAHRKTRVDTLSGGQRKEPRSPWSP